jgi:hypothetical protein
MELDSIPQQTLQPTLFEVGEASIGALELFPAIWAAAEALTVPDLSIRQGGLARLVELGAPRLSPLIACLLATCLADPDVELRRQIVYVLGDILTVDAKGRPAPDAVRRCLTYALSQMRQRPIYTILEVYMNDRRSDIPIARLFNACPYAGRHLADILAERKYPVAIRRSAAHFIGLVGYLDAIPALEKILSRLESRVLGQQSMPFAPLATPDEMDLRPEVRAALASLRIP